MDWTKEVLPALILLVAAGIGSAIGWFLRSRVEESRVIRAKLNEERRRTYSDALTPFVSVLASTKAKDGASKAVAQMMRDLPELQRNRVDLVLFGSDDVVRAHNACWQYAYSVDAGEGMEQRGVNYMLLWGRLLLEIRKDVGNKHTKLDELDMLRWLITDIDKLERTKDREG